MKKQELCYKHLCVLHACALTNPDNNSLHAAETRKELLSKAVILFLKCDIYSTGFIAFRSF